MEQELAYSFHLGSDKNKGFWHRIIKHFQVKIGFDRDVHFKEVAKELFKNDIFSKYENDIVNDVAKKVKTKDEIKKKDDRRF